MSDSNTDNGISGFGSKLGYIVAMGLMFSIAINAAMYVADPTSEELEEAAEKVETPYENQPWWQMGALPVLLIAGIFLGILVLTTATRWTIHRIREYIVK